MPAQNIKRKRLKAHQWQCNFVLVPPLRLLQEAHARSRRDLGERILCTVVMASRTIIHSRKIGWRGTSIMSDIFMTKDTRKFIPAGNLFQIPGTEDLQDLPALFV